MQSDRLREARTAATQEVGLSIEGMTCAACAVRIAKKLNKLDEVRATVNYATADGEVEFGQTAIDRSTMTDGPALAAADLGLALGSGTEVAISAADMILLRDDLRTVPDAIGLARAAFRTIRRNLGWAFGYNVAAIPLAALGFLNPIIASAAMTLSSLFVVASSLRLRRRGTTPRREPATGVATLRWPVPGPEPAGQAGIRPAIAASSRPERAS
jgi:Cu+-exporting ATPase